MKEYRIRWSLQLQPEGSNLCGQSCIAIVCGKNLGQAIADVGKSGLTSTRNLVRVLKQYYHVQDRLIRIKSDTIIPDSALLKITWEGKPKHSHWVVVRNGMVYDPASGTIDLPNFIASIHGKITSYLELNELLKGE